MQPSEVTSVILCMCSDASKVVVTPAPKARSLANGHRSMLCDYTKLVLCATHAMAEDDGEGGSWRA